MATSSPPEPDTGEPQEDDSTARMSFFDHLDELRTRILHALIAVGIGMIAGFYFSADAFEFLARPMFEALRGAGLEDRLIYTSPLGPIRLLITVGLYLGLVFASPVVLYQVWMFVAPGLYRNERQAVMSFLFSSVFLFLAGTFFGYVVLLPVTLQFLIGLLPQPFTAMISINEYFDLVLVVLLGLGVVFQLPILIFFLSLFGIVTPKFLWENFRYAVLIIAVIAAVVTPTTDPLTMIIFMGPMLVLYLLGIGVSALVVRRRVTARGETAAGTGVWVALVVVLGGGAALLWAANHYGWWSVFAR